MQLGHAFGGLLDRAHGDVSVAFGAGNLGTGHYFGSHHFSVFCKSVFQVDGANGGGQTTDPNAFGVFGIVRRVFFVVTFFFFGSLEAVGLIFASF